MTNLTPCFINYLCSSQTSGRCWSKQTPKLFQLDYFLNSLWNLFVLWSVTLFPAFSPLSETCSHRTSSLPDIRATWLSESFTTSEKLYPVSEAYISESADLVWHFVLGVKCQGVDAPKMVCLSHSWMPKWGTSKSFCYSGLIVCYCLVFVPQQGGSVLLERLLIRIGRAFHMTVDCLHLLRSHGV